jgi:hypothetical protein
MAKLDDYKKALLNHPDQEQYLKENSCLPGPRSNLELLYAFIEISDFAFVDAILKRKQEVLPVNNPEEFVSCCAVAACGKHILEGKNGLIAVLRVFASDERWRIRESVAMALQHIGKTSFERMKTVSLGWERGNYYEQRAIAAGFCEPVLLKSSEIIDHTLYVLQIITLNISKNPDTTSSSYKTLVQALCYCWSVAIISDWSKGRPAFEKLYEFITNPDIKKIIRENLKKNRLIKLDKEWVNSMSQKLN